MQSPHTPPSRTSPHSRFTLRVHEGTGLRPLPALRSTTEGSTAHFSPIPFRISTYEKRAHNSFRMRIYEGNCGVNFFF
jgi:hypothetical protein